MNAVKFALRRADGADPKGWFGEKILVGGFKEKWGTHNDEVMQKANEGSGRIFPPGSFTWIFYQHSVLRNNVRPGVTKTSAMLNMSICRN